MQHQHLPPAVGFCILDETSFDLDQAFEPVGLHELADQRVVARRGGVIPVRPGFEMRVAVVGAGDERDAPRGPGRGRGDRGARPHVIRRRKLAGGSQDDDWQRRIVPAAHEPERNQHAPVHRRDRGPRLVGSEAHPGRGQARGAEGLEHLPREL